MKRKVLIFAGYYVPSVKGGGPIQSLKNLVDNLSDEIDFYIIAADRDLGDQSPFSNIKIENWEQVGKAKVFYINPANLTWKKTIEIMNSIDYDVIYLNSFFSYQFSIIPLLLSKVKSVPKKPIVLAPRGQFSPGALGLKSGKKQLFIKIAKALGFYKNSTWHATAETEKNDIEKIFGNEEKIKIANNLTGNYQDMNYEKYIGKDKGELKIVFISRVHPKKNLATAIDLLKEIKGNIEFDIYGPKEDKAYWTECERKIGELSENIKVSYKGILKHEKIIDTFKEYHVFLFPTLGENFGHVISESLIGGCPVIISNETPWRELEKKEVGWDISLNDQNRFKEVIQYCVNLNENDYEVLSKKAFEYGKRSANTNEDIRLTYNLFI